MKHAILICAFYNKELLDRTLESIYANNCSHDFDIYFLENPSERSSEIHSLKNKYPKIKFYICQENIDIGIFDAFIKHYMKEELEKYEYITICEGDVVLDKESINEVINILDNNSEVKVCSVKLHVNLKKYQAIQHLINSWVPPPAPYKDFNVGTTGLQFLTFRTGVLYNFLGNADKFPAPIAATNNHRYIGINDHCILKYCSHNKLTWAVTKEFGLDHTGWEGLLDMENSAYYKRRTKDIENNKIRVTRLDYSIYDFTLLENE